MSESTVKKTHYSVIDGFSAYSAIGILLMYVLVNGNYALKGFVFEERIPSFTNLVILFMMGSVFPAMHKYIWVPAFWVVWHNLKALFMKKLYSMFENKIVRDYRDGKVTKEELDQCSTCDLCAVVSDGLSETSREQLKERSGEEIVDADISMR